MAQPGTLHTCAFAWPRAAGQDSAWRINLSRERVLSMYKFSSLPLAISAATAMASWASSSSDDGGAAASRGRGASILHAFAAGAVAPLVTLAGQLRRCTVPMMLPARGSAWHGARRWGVALEKLFTQFGAV